MTSDSSISEMGSLRAICTFNLEPLTAAQKAFLNGGKADTILGCCDFLQHCKYTTCSQLQMWIQIYIKTCWVAQLV